MWMRLVRGKNILQSTAKTVLFPHHVRASGRFLPVFRPNKTKAAFFFVADGKPRRRASVKTNRPGELEERRREAQAQAQLTTPDVFSTAHICLQSPARQNRPFLIIYNFFRTPFFCLLQSFHLIRSIINFHPLHSIHSMHSFLSFSLIPSLSVSSSFPLPLYLSSDFTLSIIFSSLSPFSSSFSLYLA